MVNDLYEEEISKVIGQRNELVSLLKKVLYAWEIGWLVSSEGELYAEAADYLKGLRDE